MALGDILQEIYHTDPRNDIQASSNLILILVLSYCMIFMDLTGFHCTYYAYCNPLDYILDKGRRGRNKGNNMPNAKTTNRRMM